MSTLYDMPNDIDFLIGHSQEHMQLYHALYEGDTDWPARRPIFIKREKAVRWLNRRLAGVTREYGFTDDMTDEEVYALIEDMGLVWHNGDWHDFTRETAIHEAVSERYPSDWIWGTP